jgi:hypothetical protein
MIPIAVRNLTVLPSSDTIPPASEWNWTPDVGDLESVIGRLGAAKSPMTSRDTGYVSGQDFGENF